MDHFTFECLENIKPPNIDEVKPGWQYISLLQHNNEENVKSNTKPRSHRCAVSILCLHVILYYSIFLC